MITHSFSFALRVGIRLYRCDNAETLRICKDDRVRREDIYRAASACQCLQEEIIMPQACLSSGYLLNSIMQENFSRSLDTQDKEMICIKLDKPQ